MKALAVELKKPDRREFQCLGWKSPKTGGRRLQFYARDQSGSPIVFTLTPVLPKYFDPQIKAAFTAEPFPEAVCVEISPWRLLAPPCFESETDFLKQRHCLDAFDPWRGAYISTHNEYLVLEPRHDEKLDRRRLVFLDVIRERYEEEKRERLAFLENLKSASLESLGLGSDSDRLAAIKEEEEQMAILESEYPIDGVPCKGNLRLTLDQVQQGVHGIRDAVLHEEWARKNGWDLRDMRRDRICFRKWLEAKTGFPTEVLNARFPVAAFGLSRPDFGRDHDRNPQFLQACAKVRFRARFANNAASVVYLADCELREEPTAVELSEIAVMEGALDLQEPTKVTLEEAKRKLARPGKDPITDRWLKELCQETGVAFRFPMSERDFLRIYRCQQRLLRSKARTVTKNLPKRA